MLKEGLSFLLFSPEMPVPTKKIKAFTCEELAFMQNGGLFDQKEEITKRIQEILENLLQSLKARLKPQEFIAPENTDFIHGQLVRGERFHGRPYVYLDFPKFFSREAIFTYRSFFWWGWDFVFAYLLSGPYLDLYKKKLINNLDCVLGKGYYLSVATNPWEWRRPCPETLELAGQSSKQLEQILRGMDFLKIQYFVPLDHPLWVEGGLVEEGVRIFKSLKFIVAK